MARVTGIQAQKNGQFYSIFVDEKYSFSLGDLELSASSLRVGSELSDAEVAEWTRSSGISKLRNLALRYLAIRPRSELEIKQYLERKGAADEEIQQVQDWLRSYGYLNDSDFARRWTQYRRREGQRSDPRIRSELKQKGINQDSIDEALQQGEYDQSAALKDLIAKRRHRYADERKLVEYLARQGYRWSEIKAALTEEAD